MKNNNIKGGNTYKTYDVNANIETYTEEQIMARIRDDLEIMNPQLFNIRI